jgi:hypothetical protein
VRENERKFYLGFEEKELHVSYMQWNIWQWLEEQGVHMALMD